MNESVFVIAGVYILVFCRVGTALLLLPGLSNSRFPATLRIFMALCVSLTLTPMVFVPVAAALSRASSLQAAVATELVIGLAFGFWCFCFLHASRFAGTIIATVTGLAGMPGQPIDESDPTSHLATLLSLAATIMIFASDLHLFSLAALVHSYDAMPAATIPAGAWLAENSVRLAKDTSVLALQVASPFIVLVVVTNLALGLCGKFTPQLQIYFASLGLTIMLAFATLSLLFPGLARISTEAYSSWLMENAP